MTIKKQKEITKISKEFLKGFKDMVDGINGSGWLVCDPLSGYLNACGYVNKLSQYPANGSHHQVLILTFQDGNIFIPAGGDLKSLNSNFKNWMWIDERTLSFYKKNHV